MDSESYARLSEAGRLLFNRRPQYLYVEVALYGVLLVLATAPPLGQPFEHLTAYQAGQFDEAVEHHVLAICLRTMPNAARSVKPSPFTALPSFVNSQNIMRVSFW